MLANFSNQLFLHTLAPLTSKDYSIDPFLSSKTAKDLDWQSITASIANLTRTTQAAQLAEALTPLSTPDLATSRLVQVDEFTKLLGEKIEPPISPLHDLQASFLRLAIQAPVSAEELAALARNCEVIARVAQFFREKNELAPVLSEIASFIDPLDQIRSTLSHAIEPSGRISDYASGELKSLRRAVQLQTERLRERVDSLLQDETFESHLQDDFYTLREGRYVIPIRASAKTTVNGIIHGYSQSGQTAYIEPEILIKLNNDLRWAQIAVDEEEERILTRLSSMISSSLDVLRKNIHILAYLDLHLAIAKFSCLYSGTIPTITAPPAEDRDKTELILNALRHPILHIKLGEHLAEGEENPNVSNDLRIGEGRRVLVVSGPNTGGKTVLLKSFGLAVLMAKTGLPVPAEEASIPFYGSIYSDIGDEQSIQKDLSTFSSHVVNITGFLPRCGPNSLVLLDELFTGTDPMQGASLAAALLERLAEMGATTLVTTHLESLKTIALQNERFANASMGFDLDSLQPNYILTLGVPGSSFALRIADRLGFPADIVEVARIKLSQEGRLGIDSAMEKLEQQANELRSETNRLQHQRRKAEAAEKKYRKKYDSLSLRDRDLVNQHAKKLQADLKMVDQLLRQKIKELQVGESLQRKDLEHIRDTIRIQEKVIERVKLETAKESVRPDGLVPLDFGDLSEGMEVYALNFKRNGIITLIDEAKKRVQIQVGVMKSYVGVDEIFSTKRISGARTEPSKEDSPSIQVNQQPLANILARQEGELADILLPQNIENTVDLRGMRQEDAIEKLDFFIDAAARAGMDGIYIIHGFGSGILRKAIRNYLKTGRVRKFRAGERNEGGDGVTIAFIREWKGG